MKRKSAPKRRFKLKGRDQSSLLNTGKDVVLVGPMV